MADHSIDVEKDEPIESARRNFLKTAGKLALYTPPAVMILMHPSREALASGGGGPRRRPRGGRLIRRRRKEKRQNRY